MEREEQTKPTRREILRAFLAMPATFLLTACAGETASQVTPETIAQAQPTSEPPTSAPPAPTHTLSSAPTVIDTPTPAQALLPTPACGDDDDDDITPAQTEGPFYTPNSPERTSLLELGIIGTKIIVTGQVLATDCTPIGGALVDFWHADDSGAYDNVGYKLRGHQFADDQGRYTLETIVPGLYPGRTRHFHVKVQAPNQPILTTQLYFPDEPDNANDGIFQPELLMTVQDAADGKAAAFNFVLDMG